MKLLGPTRHQRVNEVAALAYVLLALAFTLSLVSYHPNDPSWNTATGGVRPQNHIGFPGAYLADSLLQAFGAAAFLLPVFVIAMAWKWLRSRPIEMPRVRLLGSVCLLLTLCALLRLLPDMRLFGGSIPLGGVTGLVLGDWLLGIFNMTGALLVLTTALLVSLYLASTFSMQHVAAAADPLLRTAQSRYTRWTIRRREQRRLQLERRKQQEADKTAARAEERRARQEKRTASAEPAQPHDSGEQPSMGLVKAGSLHGTVQQYVAQPTATLPPEVAGTALAPDSEESLDDDLQADEADLAVEEIPIRPLAELPQDGTSDLPPWDAPTRSLARPAAVPPRMAADFTLPSTGMLNEQPGRSAYDTAELQETAVSIKSKFQEFNVHGTVVQINPGPVVTTYEFKPEAGIKLSRITTLSEDLCLGLQAESVMIERIPGKPTVGIEVPNSKSEIISFRQILESEEFINSPSHLTIALGKDINGRIKVAALETMPHLLIAGSTGSGKSVMLNAMIMSILYKSTPNEVRLIMVDPKRVELGMYEGIPHLLTPVITDPKKATNALRNAVLEMERRLKLLASQGVRNIAQFNQKVQQLADQPRQVKLDGEPEEELLPLPFILIIIDELADLMMLERAGVEECVTRLAQMARAVGMHVVLATQRPSVDVITGLIKANFPARISFRVATRVDSRTILDCMGAEHLLGRGDMLFLPPGSSRLVRVHGAYVSESETVRVVEYWKQQAQPSYDQSFLVPPPTDDEAESGEEGEGAQAEDPVYQDAVRVVLEMGKASTSTLQRRLRLGYGRAARILDMMQRDGIIGPPDGSKPREVLKRPEWLNEVDYR